MTTGKGQSSTNPLITVPLPKGVNRHERVSEDLAPSSSIENQKIQVPLYRGVPNTGYQAQNYQQMNQDDVTAPPVPVRVGTVIQSYHLFYSILFIKNCFVFYIPPLA